MSNTILIKGMWRNADSRDGLGKAQNEWSILQRQKPSRSKKKPKRTKGYLLQQYIYKNWNNREKIFMAPVQGWHADSATVHIFVNFMLLIFYQNKKQNKGTRSHQKDTGATWKLPRAQTEIIGIIILKYEKYPWVV